MAPRLAISFPAVPKAVPRAGVATGIGNPAAMAPDHMVSHARKTITATVQKAPNTILISASMFPSFSFPVPVA